MLASGFDITTADKLADGGRRAATKSSASSACVPARERLADPLGSNRDRHAPPGDGELGPRGCAAFLSEPRFEELPALFEGPGVDGHAPEKVDVDKLKKLRAQGLRSRKRRS